MAYPSQLDAAALGSAALALMLLLSMLERSSVALRSGVSTALGIGALGYPIFWLLAGLTAPGLGGTGAAKQSLEWLAVPTAGLLLVGLLGVIVLFVMETFAATRSDP